MRFSLPNLRKKTETRKHVDESLLEKHWGTIVSLLGIFFLAFFIRTYFAFELATKYGTPYLLSGGSDAYYYGRIIDYIQTNHQHLTFDPLLNYPMGSRNPRPPIFAWSVVLIGHLFSPFVGSVNVGINYAFILSTGFWGALTIFPVYLIGRDTFGKKAGMTAAFLLAISSGHLQRSPITNGDHDAIYLFFVVTAFYFFMKALEGIPDDKNWISSYKDPEAIKDGVKSFILENKRSLLYSGLSGMSIASVALIWKGYAYVVVILLAYYFIQLFIDRLRMRDSLGITACIAISVGLAFLVSSPYYLVVGIGPRYFDIPLLMFVAGFSVGIFLTVTRDWPWVLTFSIILAGFITFILLGLYVFPSLMTALTSGAGYFVQTKAISTIAEAQAPAFSNLVMSFGLISFFLSIVGIGLAIWHFKGSWKTNFLFILLWTALAIYMAMSAARFIFNSSPAFALTAGWVIALLVDKTNFAKISKIFRSFRGDVFYGLWKSIKLRHATVAVFVVFMIMVPNAMYAMDSGIPYGEKEGYNKQIHSAIPGPMRPEEYNVSSGDNWYLGAFGYALDKPNEYWPASWDWLSKQDTDVEPAERPGFLSWWDYGFECARQGEHPTVADNFLNGHELAGNILMAQNESEILALFITRQLEDTYSRGDGFDDEVEDILVDYIGEEKTRELEKTMKDPEKYTEEVLSNPDKYHHRDDELNRNNVKYARCMGLLAEEGLDILAELYRDISLKIDKRIKYIAVDTRLFPFSGTNTGIFYAPAKLSGHRIYEKHGMRTPIDYYKVLLVDEQGNEYENPDKVPQDIQITDYKIDFQPAFFNSTLYKVFAGYSAQEVDEGEGIPGLDDNNKIQPMPSWNMTHFRLAYRTAYFNPYPRDEVGDHPEAWKAISYDEAVEHYQDENVTVDLSAQSYMRQGVVYLEYFDGALISGEVTTEDGEPISNARITVLDKSATPHDMKFTDDDGRYEVKVPSGNVSVIASVGGLEQGQKVQKVESVMLGSFSLNISEEQAMREKRDRDGDGKWDYLIDKNIRVDTGNLTVNVFVDEDGDTEFSFANDTLVPGQITIENQRSGVEYVSEENNGSYTFTDVMPGIYKISTDVKGAMPKEDVSIKGGSENNQSLMLTTGKVSGNVNVDAEGVNATSIELMVKNEDGEDIVTSSIDGDGNYSIENLRLGTYSLHVNTDDYAIREGAIRFTIEEEVSLTKNFNISRARKINLRTKLSNTLLPYQKISFIDKENYRYSQTIETGKEGKTQIKLPLGKYLVYGNMQRDNKFYVHMNTIDVTEGINYTAELIRGFRVKGEVDSPEVSSGMRSNILFSLDENKQALASTNEADRYSIIVEPGDYNIFGWGSSGVKSSSFWKTGTIDSETIIDFQTTVSYRAKGKVYRDLNLNDQYDKGEGISAGIKVTVAGNNYFFNAGRDGNYTLTLPDKECKITFSKVGFVQKSVVYDPDEEFSPDINMRAKNLSVSGDIICNEGFSSLPIEFEPLSKGAVLNEISVKDTEYSTELQPGDYKVTIFSSPSEGERYIYSIVISLEPGEEEIELDLPVKYQVRMTGKIFGPKGESAYADIRLSGPEVHTFSGNGTYSGYFTPGNYTLWAVNKEEELINQTEVSLISPLQLNITMEEAYIFSPFVTFDEEPRNNIPVMFEQIETGFEFNETTDSDGTISLPLVSGTYKVTVYHETREPVEGVLRDVRYHYSDTFEVGSHMSPEIALNRDIINATLEGTLKADGEGVQGATIEFIANGPESMDAEVTTGSDGTYQLDISRGLYTIYCHVSGSSGLYAQFNEFIMPDSNETLNINLSKAHKMTGSVIKDSQGIEADIKVSSARGVGEKVFHSDANGDYEIVLPSGGYMITVTDESDGENVYKASDMIELDYSLKKNFDLKMVKEYGIETEELVEKRAEQGDNISFEVTVKNTGNTKDTYEFSAPKAVWDLEFTPKKVEVESGKTKTFAVDVHVSEDASANHPPISFNIDSVNSDKTEEVTLPIKLKHIYGVDVVPVAKSTIYDNGKLTYRVKVENTGNGDDSYKLTLLNKESLASRGWEVSVTNETETIADGMDEEIEIVLLARASKPSRKVSIELEVVSNGDSSVYEEEALDVVLPEIKSSRDNFSLQGKNLATEKEKFEITTRQWSVIIILASITTFYVARKKRWI
ncbi:MAG: carboxypeptidase regulatory-like domain-containing protein [Thermoplasmata archaeon]